MGKADLTEAQQKVLSMVAAEPNLKNFYLTGGTALAGYYIHHRVSDDLDLFSFDEPDGMFLHVFADRIKETLRTGKVRFERLFDRNQFFFEIGAQELKVEFTKYPFRQLEEPAMFDGMRVDSLRDIAANKLMAMLDRFDPKDFVDLHFLLQKFRLEDIRADAETKFKTTVDNVFLGGELVKARRIAALPKMLKPVTVEELKNFFAERATELASGIFKK